MNDQSGCDSPKNPVSSDRVEREPEVIHVDDCWQCHRAFADSLQWKLNARVSSKEKKN